MSQNNVTRIAIVAGGRTSFIKLAKLSKDLGPLKLGSQAVSGLIQQHDVDPTSIEALAYGIVVHNQLQERDIPVGPARRTVLIYGNR